jgi:hypothetical protein
MRKWLALCAFAVATAAPAHAASTDLEKIQKLVKRYADDMQTLAPTKVVCACQGGTYDTRIGTLEVLTDAGVGGYVGCYALSFDGDGKITGKFRCETYAVLPR